MLREGGNGDRQAPNRHGAGSGIFIGTGFCVGVDFNKKQDNRKYPPVVKNYPVHTKAIGITHKKGIYSPSE